MTDEAVSDADADMDTDPDLPEQQRVRRDKRQQMLDSGIEPYPLGFPRTHTLAEIRADYADLPVDATTGDRVAVTGRAIYLRNGGKLCFATLRDGDGTELQAMLSLDRLGAESLQQWKSLVDLGDHVGVEGEVVSSRRGELSVLVDRWQITSKALRPLPVAHKPLSDETRVRMRYVDLIVRDEARKTARLRSAVVLALRSSFHERGFVEVETPMLQTVQGGAAARPFVTHMNALDLDLYLRIAPELYLKRCVVGGIEKVFEINRDFRNEGADSTHSPEFAMLEFYQAYSDYDGVADLTRDLVQEAALAATGSLVIVHPDGTERDLGNPWDSVTLFGSLSEAVGTELGPESEVEELREFADAAGIKYDETTLDGKLAEELFEHHVVPSFTRPTFVRDFPVDTSPLVRDHRSKPGLVEKWDLYVDGFELATGYSELVDPVVQRERLVEQAALGERGDAEAMQLDEDFLRALEYGMPPSGGVGMGIDRLLMALTGIRSIRETILFPLVKPE
jgi:lysyl-tRNA synthetase, class II